MSNKFDLNWSTMFSYMTYKAFLTGATLWAHVLDPTVWLDGARPTNTCIPPSFP
jgi:hypothetical protein